MGLATLNYGFSCDYHNLYVKGLRASSLILHIYIRHVAHGHTSAADRLIMNRELQMTFENLYFRHDFDSSFSINVDKRTRDNGSIRGVLIKQVAEELFEQCSDNMIYTKLNLRTPSHTTILLSTLLSLQFPLGLLIVLRCINSVLCEGEEFSMTQFGGTIGVH